MPGNDKSKRYVKDLTGGLDPDTSFTDRGASGCYVFCPGGKVESSAAGIMRRYAPLEERKVPVQSFLQLHEDSGGFMNLVGKRRLTDAGLEITVMGHDKFWTVGSNRSIRL